jgi:hypothetical protein
MRSFVLKVTLTIVMLMAASNAKAGLIYTIENARLVGVSGVELNGLSYDVRFGHSCLTMYNGCDASLFAFSDIDQSVAALNALYNQALRNDVMINGVEYDFDTNTQLLFSIDTIGFAEIWVPYATTASNAISVWGINAGAINDWRIASTNYNIEKSYGFGDARGPGDRTYMVFTEWSLTSSQVPESSTLAVFAVGLMALASRRFLKKSK